MNIYLTGHGFMVREASKDNRRDANFYVKKEQALDSSLIPSIVDGTAKVETIKTTDEHYLFGTQIDSEIDEYRIEGFNDSTLPDIELGRQTLRQRQRADGDINVYPFTTDETENNINDVRKVIERSNTLTAILAYYKRIYPQEPLTFHWAACRNLIYPELID